MLATVRSIVNAIANEQPSKIAIEKLQLKFANTFSCERLQQLYKDANMQVTRPLSTSAARALTHKASLNSAVHSVISKHWALTFQAAAIALALAAMPTLVSAAKPVVAAASVANHAHIAALQEPALLRTDPWVGANGTLSLPNSLAAVPVAQWPSDGWYALTLKNGRIESRREGFVKTADQPLPNFLQSIATQRETGLDLDALEGDMFVSRFVERDADDPPTPRFEDRTGELFIRVPGVQLHQGNINSYRFQNGTSALVPMLNHRYDLTHEGQSFSFKFTKQYGINLAIEYDGLAFHYALDMQAEKAHVGSIADIDGDGKPDFIVSSIGEASTSEHVILSSQAKPGKNKSTARLDFFVSETCGN
jgi:hypothetical protein